MKEVIEWARARGFRVRKITPTGTTLGCYTFETKSIQHDGSLGVLLHEIGHALTMDGWHRAGYFNHARHLEVLATMFAVQTAPAFGQVSSLNRRWLIRHLSSINISDDEMRGLVAMATKAADEFLHEMNRERVIAI
jgi:hypothetical protein